MLECGPIRSRPSICLHIALSLGLSLFLCGSPAFGAQETSSISKTSEHDQESSLLYVSDFFAFVGNDASGHVSFAFDNNRGRDGETWQGEHLLMLLHDEHDGWQQLEGAGAYDNTKKKLLTIPNSPYIECRGTRTTGLTFTHLQSQFTLEVQPIRKRVSRKDDDSSYYMGSSAGTMTWQGRTLSGWVIHEHLKIVDFNRLTQNYFDLWTESYGLYAWVEDSPHFLYLHQQADETRLTPLVGNLVGFAEMNKEGEHLQNLTLTLQSSTQAWASIDGPRVGKDNGPDSRV